MKVLQILENKDKIPWLIYGAETFLGKKFAEIARARGENLILSGKNKKKLLDLGFHLSETYILLDFDKEPHYLNNFNQIIIINCFHTNKNKIFEIIIKYMNKNILFIDLSSNICQHQTLLNKKSISCNSKLILGLNFENLIGDLLAAKIKRKFPHASRLKIVFSNLYFDNNENQKSSHANLENYLSNWINKTKDKYFKSKTCLNPIPDKSKLCMIVPSSLSLSIWQSTRIPDVELYKQATKQEFRLMKIIGSLGICQNFFFRLPQLFSFLITNLSSFHRSKYSNEATVWTQASAHKKIFYG